MNWFVLTYTSCYLCRMKTNAEESRAGGRLRLDGYVRVSRVGGRSGEAFISPEVQRETVLAYAKAHGHEVVAWHEDLDVSGGKLDRPGLSALLARVAAGETDGIAVAKLDRLSRAGVADALKLVEEVQEAGGTVVAVDLGLDPTTMTGELVMTVLLALARMERRRLSESWEVAKSRALDRGAKIGPTPYGYTRNGDGTLHLDAGAAEHVRRAFELARDGIGPALDYLSENARGRTWTTATVRRMLANRSYLGEQHYGGDVRPDSQPAIVTRLAFEAAQHSPGRRRAAGGFPLSGAAVCGSCGAPLVGARGGADGRRMYRCSAGLATHKGDKCPAPATVTASILEEWALQEAREFLGNALAAAPDLIVPAAASDASGALEALNAAEHERDTFAADLDARSLLGDAAWRKALAARVQAVEEAEAAVRDAAKDRTDLAVSMAHRHETLTLADVGELARRAVSGEPDGVLLTLQRGRKPIDQRAIFLWGPRLTFATSAPAAE